MSAHDQIRAMLDELMGTSRDGEDNRYKLKFDDPRVCRSFLLNCCPHDILASTRMDLGECPKTHDLALRADYEQASKIRDYFFDIDAMDHLESFVGDCDRRTEQAARRLKETQEELSEEANEKATSIHALGEQIGTKLASAEVAGADGNVEESLKLMEEVENLKKQKSSAEMEFRNSMPASSYQQQKLRVCEICSAYLGIHDNDRRLADHFGGKLHLGFITIREKLAELKSKVADRRAQRDLEREQRRAERDRELLEKRTRSPSRSIDRADSRERDEDRRSSRSRRDRSHSRSRSRRHRSRSRSRSRDRRRRRKGKSRRDRSRSRERRRRHRSRSRSRSRHSRSRSRSKSGTVRNKNPASASGSPAPDLALTTNNGEPPPPGLPPQQHPQPMPPGFTNSFASTFQPTKPGQTGPEDSAAPGWGSDEGEI